MFFSDGYFHIRSTAFLFPLMIGGIWIIIVVSNLFSKLFRLWRTYSKKYYLDKMHLCELKEYYAEYPTSHSKKLFNTEFSNELEEYRAFLKEDISCALRGFKSVFLLDDPEPNRVCYIEISIFLRVLSACIWITIFYCFAQIVSAFLY